MQKNSSAQIKIDRLPFYKNLHLHARVIRQEFYPYRKDYDFNRRKENPSYRLNVACFSLEFFNNTGQSLGTFYFGHKDQLIKQGSQTLKKPFYFLSGRFDLPQLLKQLTITQQEGISLPHMAFFRKKNTEGFQMGKSLENTFQKHLHRRKKVQEHSAIPLPPYVIKNIQSYKTVAFDPKNSLKFSKEESFYTHSEQLALSQMGCMRSDNINRWSFFVENILKNIPETEKISACIMHIYSSYALCRRCASSIIFDFYADINGIGKNGRGFQKILMAQIKKFNGINISQKPVFRIIAGVARGYNTRITGSSLEKTWYDNTLLQGEFEKSFLSNFLKTELLIHEFIIPSDQEIF